MRVDEIGVGDIKTFSSDTKRKTVHNVHILDASGSMQGSKYNSAVEGINAELVKLKEGNNEVDYTITIVEFDSQMKTEITEHFFMSPLSKTERFIGRGARGGTPLYETIHKVFEKLLKFVKNDESVLVTIFTDGNENTSSQEYKDPKLLKALIDKASVDNNFTVTFMGTGDDVEYMVNTIKLHRDNTHVHQNTASSIGMSYMTRSENLQSYSKGVASGQAVSDSFFKQVEKDK